MIVGGSLFDVNVFPGSVLVRPRQCSCNWPPCEALMPFAICSYTRFRVCRPVTYQIGLFEGHGTVWNLSFTGWPFSDDAQAL